MPVKTLKTWADELAPGLDAAPESLRRSMRTVAEYAYADARDRASKFIDTGKFYESIRLDVTDTSMAISANRENAKSIERGAYLQGSPWLAIPLRRDVRRVGDPSRDGKLFLIRTRDGRAFLVSRHGGSLDVRWKLQRSVRLPKHPSLQPAWRRAARVMARVIGEDWMARLGQPGATLPDGPDLVGGAP